MRNASFRLYSALPIYYLNRNERRRKKHPKRPPRRQNERKKKKSTKINKKQEQIVLGSFKAVSHIDPIQIYTNTSHCALGLQRSKHTLNDLHTRHIFYVMLYSNLYSGDIRR